MSAAIVEIECRNAKFGIVSKILWGEVGMDRTNFAEGVVLQCQFSKNGIDATSELLVVRSNIFQALNQDRFPPPISTPAGRRVAEGACRLVLKREGASPFPKERP